MIRDPSDGTMRDIPAVDPSTPRKSASTGPDTGLRQPTRTDAQERLEKSRSWIVDYYAKKERENG